MTSLHSCFTRFIQNQCRENDTQEEQCGKLKRWEGLLAGVQVEDFCNGKGTPDVVSLLMEHHPNLSSSTVNRYLSVLQSALNSSGVLSTRGIKFKHLREPDSKEDTLSDEEVERVRSVLSIVDGNRTASLVRFLHRTGCRVGEALSLEWSDVSDRNQDGWSSVTIRSSKGGRPRTVFVDWALGSGDPLAVFTVPYRTFLAAWKRAVRSIGRPGVTPHALRHTWATNAARAGVPLPTIARALGHRSITTTARYLHAGDDDVRRAMVGAGGDTTPEAPYNQGRPCTPRSAPSSSNP